MIIDRLLKSWKTTIVGLSIIGSAIYYVSNTDFEWWQSLFFVGGLVMLFFEDDKLIELIKALNPFGRRGDEKSN